MSRIALPFRRLPFPALALPLAFLVMTTLDLRPALRAADLDQWQAGERITSSSPAHARLAAVVLRRAATLEPALGLTGAAARRVDVVEDRRAGATVNEVDYTDARGRPIGLLRLAADGRLLAAIRLDYRDAYAQATLSGRDAEQSARRIATDLALPIPDGGPDTRATMNGLMWTVRWPRVVDGAPVPGDGLTVRLWRSGDLHSVTVSERPLAPPATVLEPAGARAVIEGMLPTLVSTERRADGTLGVGTLGWVAANDLSQPERADAPATTLRLAYVFELRFGGPSAELVRALAFWIDAETGELIGGDVLR